MADDSGSSAVINTKPKEVIPPTKSKKEPDHGQPMILPGAEGAPDNVAPQPLDHFKRGYHERANLRERDLDQLNQDFDDKNNTMTKDGKRSSGGIGGNSGNGGRGGGSGGGSGGDYYSSNSSSWKNPDRGGNDDRSYHRGGRDGNDYDHDRDRSSGGGGPPPHRRGGDYHGRPYHDSRPQAYDRSGDNHGGGDEPYGRGGDRDRHRRYDGPGGGRSGRGEFPDSNAYSNGHRPPGEGARGGGGGPPPNNNRRPRPGEFSRSDAAIREREAKRLRDSYRERTDRERDRERDRDRDRENAYATFASIGFDVADLVDRLCNANRNPTQVNVANLERELERAKDASPASFETGKAITAILSALARRKQMHTALAVWKWMDSVRIPRNVFHYNAMISVCEKMKDFNFAMKLLSRMESERCRKNEVTFSSAISACEKTGQWKRAIELLEQMKREGIPQTAIAYNATISACEKGMNPAKAMEVFDTMKRSGVTPTVVTYSALISACEKGQQWKLALEVLEEMKQAGHGANVIAYSAAISALSKGQQWEKALELFREIEQSGGRPSVVTYNATMTALEKGLQWERALDLFDEMKFKNMPVTVVSYGSAISACEKGYQWRQCLDYLDEMTERGIAKNVIIFGAAMSCMEKSCRADIAFQLMDRMKLEGVSPNVHIYNSAISACARCNLWKDGLRLFEEMDEARVKKDVVTYNAVLDSVASNVPLARRLFQEGVERGFYARVSRLGTQWLELDLHFLSLGGGEIALGWWFEECLVPYLGNSSKLAAVKSIDIVTGYGKTRMRGARQGGDGMRKRILAMLKYMNIHEIEQPNKGRIHINKEALQREVEKNGGRIIFDEVGYNRWKEEETTANQIPTVQQVRRNRNGAPRKDADLGVSELTNKRAMAAEQDGYRRSPAGGFDDNYYGPSSRSGDGAGRPSRGMPDREGRGPPGRRPGGRDEWGDRDRDRPHGGGDRDFDRSRPPADMRYGGGGDRPYGSRRRDDPSERDVGRRGGSNYYQGGSSYRGDDPRGAPRRSRSRSRERDRYGGGGGEGRTTNEYDGNGKGMPSGTIESHHHNEGMDRDRHSGGDGEYGSESFRETNGNNPRSSPQDEHNNDKDHVATTNKRKREEEAQHEKLSQGMLRPDHHGNNHSDAPQDSRNNISGNPSSSSPHRGYDLDGASAPPVTAGTTSSSDAKRNNARRGYDMTTQN